MIERVRRQAQAAIDDCLLPEGTSQNDYVDAAEILRERGHNQEQIARLCGELGKDLILAARGEDLSSQSSTQAFGPKEKQVRRYHRVHDAKFIEDALSSFRERPLYKRVMEGEDPVAKRRRQRLQDEGRGRHRVS